MSIPTGNNSTSIGGEEFGPHGGGGDALGASVDGGELRVVPHVPPLHASGNK